MFIAEYFLIQEWKNFISRCVFTSAAGFRGQYWRILSCSSVKWRAGRTRVIRLIDAVTTLNLFTVYLPFIEN
jgi:hypothetical protein